MLQLANKNNLPMTTLRTEQEIKTGISENLHWNIATSDRRNIANSLKGFARVFQIHKANKENSK
jgi:hypothetical protein